MLREIIAAPDGGLRVAQAGQVMQHVEVRGGPGVNGRGILVVAPHARVHDFLGVAGGDDTFCAVGNTRGGIAIGGRITGGVRSKSIIAYTSTVASNQPGPIYSTADGQAFRWIDYHVEGLTRLNGGIYEFERCKFDIGPIGAVNVMGHTRVNLIDCDFIAILNPYADRPYFYPLLLDGKPDPCGVRVAGLVAVEGAAGGPQQSAAEIEARLYFANCRLRTFKTWEESRAWLAGKATPHVVEAADGPRLCRRFPSAADIKVKRNAYGLPGSVPTSVFLKTPNS